MGTNLQLPLICQAAGANKLNAYVFSLSANAMLIHSAVQKDVPWVVEWVHIHRNTCVICALLSDFVFMLLITFMQ